MMNALAKSAMKLKMVQDKPHVQEQWCVGHQKDMERIFEMVDNLIDQAVASNNSPMAYQLLQQTKTQFIDDLLEIADSYRKIA
jgi:hypothetical protein